MYGLKYTIPFKTISEVPCVINLEVKDFAGESTELKAGQTPIRIDTDEEDVLTPIRSSSATIQVFGSDYLQDLYASDPQGVKVTLLVGGVVKWLGYLTPDTFSQDFSSPKFIYEMEMVAALSTLRYKEFDLTDDFVTFREIIAQAVVYAGYEFAYITNSVRTATGSILDLKISSSNFYDELGEAMTYYEVLEEWAKYLGCCFTPYGADLYLLDYAAIKAGYNSYTKLDGLTGTTVTLSDAKVIENYRGTGAKISRIAGKNKAVVNCSLYEVESMLPDIENDVQPGIGRSIYEWNKAGDPVKHTIVTIPAFYNSVGGSVETVNYGIFDKGSRLTKVARYQSDNIPNKLSFNSELRVQNYYNQAAHDSGNHFTSADWVLKMKQPGTVFIHNKVYLAFFCEVMANVDGIKVSSNYGHPESQDSGLIMVEPWNAASGNTVWPLKLKLRIGDYYYNGNAWDTSETTFNVGIEIKKDEKKFGRFIPVKDTNNYELGIGDLSGYIINPPPYAISGELELTVYALWPSDFNTDPAYPYGVKYTFMKNLRLDYAIHNPDSVFDFTQNGPEDVIFESDISSEYVDPADEINLKICTNVDNKLALSSVLKGAVILTFLDELVSDVFGTAKPEELLISRVVGLYSNPRYVIDPTLKNDARPYTIYTESHLGKTFAVAGGEEDVKMESTRCNLIEI